MARRRNINTNNNNRNHHHPVFFGVPSPLSSGTLRVVDHCLRVAPCLLPTPIAPAHRPLPHATVYHFDHPHPHVTLRIQLTLPLQAPQTTPYRSGTPYPHSRPDSSHLESSRSPPCSSTTFPGFLWIFRDGITGYAGFMVRRIMRRVFLRCRLTSCQRVN